MNGTVLVLNVGKGDTKLSFDPENPQDAIRAARIVKDMLRRGYALLIEIATSDGAKAWQRVQEFREDINCYIIADFDPEIAATVDEEERHHEHVSGPSTPYPAPATTSEPRVQSAGNRGSRGRTRVVAATETRAIAIGRSAGG
jgi:hypothetical protein